MIFQRKPFIIVLFLAFYIFQTSSLSATNLISSRDSLITILDCLPQNEKERRLELLNHLCDIDFSLGKSEYLYACWNEAVSQKDINTMDDLIVPIIMRFQRKELNDSVNNWLRYNNEYIGGARAQCNAEYLQLMKDIKDWKNYESVADRILIEQVNIDRINAPYKAMRILYTLGIISSFERMANKLRSMKSSNDYMIEALDIARKQPFRESLRFQRQILLGLGSADIQYAREYVDFAKLFFNEPEMKNRPFYSRRTLISAYDKMITNGKELSRQELDDYYTSICNLIEQYPQDVVGIPAYFNAKIHFRYNLAIDNKNTALRWCDSLIAYSPKNEMTSCYYIGDKMRLLGSLERWEEGYKTANLYFHIKDSLINASNETKMLELQTQYEVDKLQQETILHRNRLSFSILFGFLLLILLATYIIYSQRLKKRNKILYQKIREQESTNEKVIVLRETLPKNQLTKEELLFNEIHKKMWETKVFTDPEFGRDELSSLVRSNRTYIADSIRTYSEDGLSVMEYINEQRLRFACSLLETCDELTIDNIAIDSGFSSSRTFFRQFKAKYFLTPTEYRKISHS